MHAQGLQHDVVTCNLILESLCHRGKISKAWEPVEKMGKYHVLWNHYRGLILWQPFHQSCIASDIIFILQ